MHAVAAMPAEVEDFQQVDIRLHNLTKKERTDRLPPGRKCLVCLAHIPILNLVLVPFYVNPPPETIRAVLQTCMIVNALALGRIHWKEDLTEATAEDKAEFVRLLGDYAKIVVNAFMLNVFLLLIVVLANPSRNRGRAIEVWACVRCGVVMLFWLIEFYLIQLFTMYQLWGRIVYKTDSLGIFEGGGAAIYAGAFFCIVLASWGMVQEALFNLGEEYEKDLMKQESSKCPFIYSLKNLPATQTKMALQGMTYRRLEPFANDPMMLHKIFLSAGLEPADCLDVITALQEYKGRQSS
eukprot:s1116_g5.t1